MTRSTAYLIEGLHNFDSRRRPIKSAGRARGTTPYLGASGEVDRVDGFTHEGDFLCVSEDGENLRSRRMPIAWVQRGKFWANNHVHVLGGVSVARLRFLEGALAWVDISGHLTGSAQPKLSQASLAQIRIPAFNAQEQSAIGEILGALDDKIAANQKIMAALDELMLSEYRRYSRRVGVRTLGDVAAIGGGATPSTKNQQYWGGEILWATPTDVTSLEGEWIASTDRMITQRGADLISSPLYPRWSILMTSRATIGSFALAGSPIAVNQGFIVMNAADAKLQPWLYAQVRSRVAEFKAWANGATFLELSKSVFRKLPFHEAQWDEMVRFGVTVRPLLERSECAQKENAALARTRDELLPLLMSGRITVKAAEKRVEKEV